MIAGFYKYLFSSKAFAHPPRIPGSTDATTLNLGRRQRGHPTPGSSLVFTGCIFWSSSYAFVCVRRIMRCTSPSIKRLQLRSSAFYRCLSPSSYALVRARRISRCTSPSTTYVIRTRRISRCTSPSTKYVVRTCRISRCTLPSTTYVVRARRILACMYINPNCVAPAH